LVCGIVLFKSSSYDYAQIIQDEAKQWDMGAITDVISVPYKGGNANVNCPSGYEIVQPIFPGTIGSCEREGKKYFLSGCGKLGGKYRDAIEP
jgi:hypothetical protein